MTTPQPDLSIQLNPANPGQFFACCGLLELADRLWNGAKGWFHRSNFLISNRGEGTLNDLIAGIRAAECRQLDPEDHTSSAISLASPFELRLDWWLDTRSGGRELKVWAGSMRNVRIAKAMKDAFISDEFLTPKLLDVGQVVYELDRPTQKVEPFYFDARRGANAQSLDIGFAPDALTTQGMRTLAYPAVEFLCLVGLQRFRPRPTHIRRVFDYYTWSRPLTVNLAAWATCGMVSYPGLSGFRFVNAFRTNQKKHKSFLPAQPLT